MSIIGNYTDRKQQKINKILVKQMQENSKMGLSKHKKTANIL